MLSGNTATESSFPFLVYCPSVEVQMRPFTCTVKVKIQKSNLFSSIVSFDDTSNGRVFLASTRCMSANHSDHSVNPLVYWGRVSETYMLFLHFFTPAELCAMNSPHTKLKFAACLSR